MATVNEKIVPVDIEDEMRGSYIDYSMSVIVARALPDVRDGLKPVHRRVLFGMPAIRSGSGVSGPPPNGLSSLPGFRAGGTPIEMACWKVFNTPPTMSNSTARTRCAECGS